MTYEKTFGVVRLPSGKYAVVTDIEEIQGRMYQQVHQALSYKSLAFALQSAERFVRACHKPFGHGDKRVEFTFANKGLLIGEGV